MSTEQDALTKGTITGREPDDFTVPPDGAPLEGQPQWRKDFPIDVTRDEYVSRRALVKFMMLTSTAFVGGHAWLAIGGGRSRRYMDVSRLAVARVDELAPGASKIFRYPKDSPPRILVRLDQERFVAYDQACTHLSCPVVPQPRDGKMHCPCHNGWFDLATGAVLAGPPRRSLPRVLLEVEGGVVYAVGLAEGAS